MVANLWPFRAIILQSLLLTVVIAIESRVLYQRLKLPNQQPLTPKQAVQYAASMNLLATVLGWLTVFALFELENLLSPAWTQTAQTAVLNVILFSQLSDESLSVLLILALITFFVSFAIKQAALSGLNWLLRAEIPVAAPDQTADLERKKLAASGLRYLRKNPRNSRAMNVGAVLAANAWSSAAVLAILLILLILPLQFRP